MVTKNIFKDRVVIITGSSGGIGKLTALEFFEQGAKVIINGRNKDKLARTVEELKEKGYDFLAIAGDVSNPEFCKKLVEKTIQKYGRIDVLINNAGGGFRGKISETDLLVFKAVIDNNLMSSIYVTKASLPYIRKSKGSIIFISSILGVIGGPNTAPYCVAKNGMRAFAESLKIEENKKIHVGVVQVGLTDYDKDKKVTASNGKQITVETESHQTREQVAKSIVKVVRKRKYLVTLTIIGKLTVFLYRFFPGLLSKILVKVSKRFK